MKRDRLILGMLLGGIFMFIAMTIFSLTRIGKRTEPPPNNITSMDALTAAATFHHLLFDNEKTRVTELIVPPGRQTPVFSYRYRSMTWVTKGTPIILTSYRVDQNGNLLEPGSVDTIAIRPDELNHARIEDPGVPISISNISGEEFRQYRIEWKE